MLKNIGIIGYGFVGNACHEAFRHNTTAIIVDPAYIFSNTIDDIVAAKPEVTFIAVSAPTLDDGSVDTSSIYSVLIELDRIKYDGLVVLKSTVLPADIGDIFKQFSDIAGLRLIYSPEFLRQGHWMEDALNPNMIVLAGGYKDCKLLEDIYDRHSHVRCDTFILLEPEEAAFLKYAINSYLATKVVFMNQLHALFHDIVPTKQASNGFEWTRFVETLSTDPRIGRSHMRVPGNDGNFGYGGSCFPKDVKAFLGADLNNRLSVLREASEANTKIRLQGSVDNIQDRT